MPQRVSWRALSAMVRHSGRDTAVRKSIDDTAEWSQLVELAASQVDLLNWLVWSKTKDGQNNRHQPKPMPRPGTLEAKNESGRTLLQRKGSAKPEDFGATATFGTASMTLDETRKMLGW